MFPGLKWSLAVRTSVLVGAIVTVSALMIGFLTIYQMQTGLLNQQRESMEIASKLHASRIENHVKALTRASRTFSLAKEVGAFLSFQGPLKLNNKAALKSELLATTTRFFESNTEVLQVDFIGSGQGGQLLRIERQGLSVTVRNNPVVARTFHLEVLETGSGVSEVRLLRRAGKVVEPHIPVLQIGHLVANKKNPQSGVIVLTYRLDSFFDDIQSSVVDKSRTVVLTDQLGQYLLHPNSKKAFAFETGQQRTIQSEFPDLTSALSSAQSGWVVGPNDLGVKRVLSFTPAPMGNRERKRFLGVALIKDYDSIVAAAKAVRSQTLWFMLVLSITALVIVFRTTKNIVNQVGGEPAEIEAITGRLAGGDLAIDFDQITTQPQGILASVKTMVESLQETHTRNVEQSWLKAEFARLTSLAQTYSNMDEFSQGLITEIAKIVSAGQGAFYVAEVKSQSGKPFTLRLRGSYAFTKRKKLAGPIELGEGLVGQCALEQRRILLSPVPHDYLTIESGLGERAPVNVLVTPIVSASGVTGVIELASFSEFTTVQLDLLEQLAKNLGVMIEQIASRQRTEELLARSQQMGEELQVQSEELRVANEELAEQSASLKENQEELRAQNEELRVANEELGEKTKSLEKRGEEIQQAREALEKRAVELQSASRYKSEFLANMSHELRTPLNSLLLLSEMLTQNEEKNLSEDQIESLRIIHNGGQDLLLLINDILDLSKVEAGKLSIHLESVSLEERFHSLRRQLGPVATAKKLDLSFQLQPGTPAELTTDAQRLEQILRNLLSNALKFTRSGSVTVIAGSSPPARPFRNPKLAQSPYLSIAVTDTGMGIPLDKQTEIFDAFQQGDGADNRKFGGTGLGLTISRELARLLEGELQLERSELGQGSTFTLYLPVTPNTAPVVLAPPPDQKPPMLSSPEKTLHAFPSKNPSLVIIEDEEAFAQTLAKFGEKRGYHCQVANTGALGLQLIEQSSPTAVLLDLGLPDMDGREVLARLQSQKATRSIPVHVISGRDLAELTETKGIISTLQKPVNRDQLTQLFESLKLTAVREVLIVEDDAVQSRSIEKVLDSAGSLNLTLATNGAEGLDCLRKQSFDCIILDYGLGDLSGIEWLEQAQQLNNGIFPPVVVYTARDLTEEEHVNLQKFTQHIIVKGGHASERLLDEVMLFLHSVEPNKAKVDHLELPGDEGYKQVLRGKTILLVDDDLRNTFALSKILKGYGLTIVIADNGEMAIKKLIEHDGVDLVLMDIMMPIVDGYEATRRIRKIPKFKDIPVIALTAKAMLEDRKKCLDAGAVDFLTKPLDVKKLLTLLHVWLSK